MGTNEDAKIFLGWVLLNYHDPLVTVKAKSLRVGLGFGDDHGGISDPSLTMIALAICNILSRGEYPDAVSMEAEGVDMELLAEITSDVPDIEWIPENVDQFLALHFNNGD